MSGDDAADKTKRTQFVSPCCGSGIKRSFYGGYVCSACRTNMDPCRLGKYTSIYD